MRRAVRHFKTLALILGALTLSELQHPSRTSWLQLQLFGSSITSHSSGEIQSLPPQRLPPDDDHITPPMAKNTLSSTTSLAASHPLDVRAPVVGALTAALLTFQPAAAPHAASAAGLLRPPASLPLPENLYSVEPRKPFQHSLPHSQEAPEVLVDTSVQGLLQTGIVLTVAALAACAFWLPALQAKWQETHEASQLATFIRQYASDLAPPRPPVSNEDDGFADLKGTLLMVIVAIGIGVGTLVYLFTMGVHSIGSVAEDIQRSVIAGELNPLAAVAVPCLGGFGVAFLWEAVDGFEENEPTTAIHQSLRERLEGLIRPAARAIAAVLTLGTGNTLGPEGPAVDIGKATARFFAGFLGDETDVYLSALLAAGAASGIAAGFNAPMSGIFFALETVFQSQPKNAKNTPALVAGVLLAAVLACTVVRLGLGDQPTIVVPAFNQPLVPPLAGVTYLILGYLAGEVSLGFTNACKATAAGFKRLAEVVPADLFPILTGAVTGAIGLLYPEILYRGFDNINTLLNSNSLTLNFLLELLIIKVAMTSVARSSGLVGGIYAPSLFMGAALGTGYGQLVTALLSPLGVPVAPVMSYSVVGMAATLGSACRVPLTGVMLLFELTRNYGLLVPTALATASAMQVVRDVTPAINLPVLDGPLFWRKSHREVVPPIIDIPLVAIDPTTVAPPVDERPNTESGPQVGPTVTQNEPPIPFLIYCTSPMVKVHPSDEVHVVLKQLLDNHQTVAVVTDHNGAVMLPGLVTVAEVHALCSQSQTLTIADVPPPSGSRIVLTSQPITEAQLQHSGAEAIVLADEVSSQLRAVVMTPVAMDQLRDPQWAALYTLKETEIHAS